MEAIETMQRAFDEAIAQGRRSRFAHGEGVLPTHYSDLLTRAKIESPHWLLFKPAEFQSAYNRLPFLFEHRLTEHPLFGLPKLFELCRRMNAINKVAYRFGVVPKDCDFDSSLEKHRGDLTLNDAIEHLEERQAYIVVNNPEIDPEYRPAIEGLLGEIAEQTQNVDAPINWYSTYLFISAQGSVTPYHMDREMNFLLQIRGTKTARLWDPMDDDVMTPAEKDELLSYAGETRPQYRSSLDAKAMIFELKPGLGVHHPFIAPHLVTTGPEVSISLAITFRTPRSDVWQDAHRVNHSLRKLGLHPKTVRLNFPIDYAKAMALRTGRRAKALSRNLMAGRPPKSANAT